MLLLLPASELQEGPQYWQHMGCKHRHHAFLLDVYLAAWVHTHTMHICMHCFRCCPLRMPESLLLWHAAAQAFDSCTSPDQHVYVMYSVLL